MRLTGCNWLNTLQPRWSRYNSDKKYDISCMFSYPTKENVYEHELCQTDYYDKHRKELLEVLMCESCQGDKYKIAGLVGGKRVPLNEYYDKMYNSKIIMAPLGYGEMAPRDVEAAMFGSILIKPDLSYINSKPFLFEDGKTYIACKYDWSDLEEKVDYVLSNYEELQSYITENMRKAFIEKNDKKNLVTHIYEIFSNLNNIMTEKKI
tara:strand:- start:15 stop:635 length:621 start_codon:yes stop_codon:yes gene_type:complete